MRDERGKGRGERVMGRREMGEWIGRGEWGEGGEEEL